MNSKGEIINEARTGKCYATINTKNDYLAYFEPTTHILACITPRMEWTSRQVKQFPLITAFLKQHEYTRNDVGIMKKSLIDKSIGRSLLDMWQLSAGKHDDFEHEMDVRVKRLLKSYENTLTSNYYLIGLSRAEKIQLVGDYLNTNFCRPDITDIEKLTAKFFVTDRTLRRAFKKEFNLTISAYVENRRLEHACILLLQTTYPIHKIALECGFNNCNYFCRVFRKKHDCTPIATGS